MISEKRCTFWFLVVLLKDVVDAEDCSSGKYTCDDGACISFKSYRCDSFYQCSDLSDERRCNICRFGYPCRSGHCTRFLSDRCDGSYDCPDESDEANCDYLAYTTSKGSTAIFIGVVIVGLVVSIVIPVVICISIICCAFCCAGVTSTSSSRRQSIPTNIIVPVVGYSSADKLNDPPPPYDSTTPSKQVYHQVDKRHDWQLADPSSIEDNLQPTTPQPRKESLSHPTRSDPLQPPTEPAMQAPNDVQPPIESSPRPPIGFKPLLPPSQHGGYPYQTGLALSPGNFPPQSVPISALSSGPLPISYPSPIGSPRLSPIPQAVSPTQPTGMPYQLQYSGASPPQEKYN